MSYILNPKSNRMVKIGGKAWRSLVREGIIANNPIQPKKEVVFPTKSEIEENEIEEPYSKSSNELSTVTPVRIPLKNKDARNKTNSTSRNATYYTQNRKGKPTKIRNRPKQQDMANYTAQCASRTLHKHMDTLNEQLEEAYRDSDELNADQLSEFENSLKELILQEMLSGQANLDPNVNTNQEKNQIIKEERELNAMIPPQSEYELQENTEYEYY